MAVTVGSTQLSIVRAILGVIVSISPTNEDDDLMVRARVIRALRGLPAIAALPALRDPLVTLVSDWMGAADDGPRQAAVLRAVLRQVDEADEELLRELFVSEE